MGRLNVFCGLLCLATFAIAAPFYEDKQDLLQYLDAGGESHQVTGVADWERRRGDIVRNMEAVMGPFPPASRRVPLELQVEEEEDFPRYVRKKISFAPETGDRLPAYLLLPKGLQQTVPAVLCLHPTSEFGKAIVLDDKHLPQRLYAAELAERGFVTLAPDYPGFGDYKDARKWLYGHEYTSATMKGIWNHSQCIDLLQTLPEVDGGRIGCIGHSLGGHNTLFLGVFDARVKVLVTSCGFNAFPKYYGGDLTGWSHDGYMPRIASEYGKDPRRMPFDFPEVLGALAPRPVFINAPLRDANFEVSGVRDCTGAAQKIYALYGAPEHLKAVHPDAEHDFPDAERQEAYAFLEEHLHLLR
ncbi:MAG: alpha/beta fold hydrolase [Candidatus Hydrogenedentes bacterium]|nr:alpha/beta fold hydrolase [Candidatus Hydrogenedentota bacterium]